MVNFAAACMPKSLRATTPIGYDEKNAPAISAIMAQIVSVICKPWNSKETDTLYKNELRPRVEEIAALLNPHPVLTPTQAAKDCILDRIKRGGVEEHRVEGDEAAPSVGSRLRLLMACDPEKSAAVAAYGKLSG